ncbi:MAG: GOLPH3/VPS74 family protein [Mycobacterium sp.]
MPQIAEDLLLLLLNNATGRPLLEKNRRSKALAAAIVLDLALAQRIRPATQGEPAKAGHLLVLNMPYTGDPVLDRAIDRLRRRPMSPAEAIAKVRRGVDSQMLHRLEMTGHIRAVRTGNGLFPEKYWPVTNIARANAVRQGVTDVLFQDAPPAPRTAAIIAVLHGINGFDAILSLDPVGKQQVSRWSQTIADGGWAAQTRDDRGPAVNLAVTAAVVSAALHSMS